MEQQENKPLNDITDVSISLCCINLGWLYNSLRYVIVITLLLMIGILYRDNKIDLNYDIVYNVLCFICFMIILRQILGYARHCGYGKLCSKYNDEDTIYWRYTEKDGLVDRVYYSIGSSIVEYELDYVRCRFNRMSGVNLYYDLIHRCPTCVSYRKYLLDSMSYGEYNDLENDRYIHSFYCFCLVTLILVIGYYGCFGIY